MAAGPGIAKKIFWPLVFMAIFVAILVVPAYRSLPPDKTFAMFLVIPFCLWVLVLMFQNDRMCSLVTQYLFILASALCLVLGFVLRQDQMFPEKAGFFVVAFGMPLLWIGISEIWRIVFVRIRHEPPCYNYRSHRWLGDPPRDGFFTTFPPGKVLSWADVIFGLTQTIFQFVLTMVLIIWSLAANW
jgi:hypothetical protein